MNHFREGDAIFWINMNTNNGHLDRLTLHGGCPVAVGSKWVTNKWIQYYDQWSQYSCTASLSEPIDVLRQWRDMEG